tara:strand:+ start:276 stop:638 length:363 start_codon:yes stop_codon:yes gene_type:complete
LPALPIVSIEANLLTLAAQATLSVDRHVQSCCDHVYIIPQKVNLVKGKTKEFQKIIVKLLHPKNQQNKPSTVKQKTSYQLPPLYNIYRHKSIAILRKNQKNSKKIFAGGAQFCQAPYKRA